MMYTRTTKNLDQTQKHKLRKGKNVRRCCAFQLHASVFRTEIISFNCAAPPARQQCSKHGYIATSVMYLMHCTGACTHIHDCTYIYMTVLAATACSTARVHFSHLALSYGMASDFFAMA
eukprot:scpid99833/ scgid32009/ 